MVVYGQVLCQSLLEKIQFLGRKSGLLQIFPANDAVGVKDGIDHVAQPIEGICDRSLQEASHTLFAISEHRVITGMHQGQAGVKLIDTLHVQLPLINHVGKLVDKKKGAAMFLRPVVPGEKGRHILHKELIACLKDDQDGRMVGVLHRVHQRASLVVWTVAARALLVTMRCSVETASFPKDGIVGGVDRPGDGTAGSFVAQVLQLLTFVRLFHYHNDAANLLDDGGGETKFFTHYLQNGTDQSGFAQAGLEGDTEQSTWLIFQNGTGRFHEEVDLAGQGSQVPLAEISLQLLPDAGQKLHGV